MVWTMLGAAFFTGLFCLWVYEYAWPMAYIMHLHGIRGGWRFYYKLRDEGRALYLKEEPEGGNGRWESIGEDYAREYVHWARRHPGRQRH